MKSSAVLSFDDLAPREPRAEPEFRTVRIVRKGRLMVAEPVDRSEPLTADAVRQTQLELRAERGKA